MARFDRRVTVADVAREAGVSRTTVSHALNGIGRVDPRTRERVRRVATELGYRPSVRAQRLRQGQARTIALVSSMPLAVAAGPSRLGFFTQVAAAAAESALMHGFALVLVPPLEVRPSLDELDIDGAIVVEPARDDLATAQLLARHVPVVSVGRQLSAEDEVPYVDMRSEAVARLLLAHLYEAGARRIALLNGTSERHAQLVTAEVYRGFATERGMPVVLVGADEAGGENAGYAACGELLRAHPELDAVCAPVDALAVGAVRALGDAGRRVPDDVRVATRYDGPRARTCRPPLTAVDLHLDELAAAAVGLLLEHVAGGATRHHVTGPAPVLVARESSAVHHDHGPGDEREHQDEHPHEAPLQSVMHPPAQQRAERERG